MSSLGLPLLSHENGDKQRLAKRRHVQGMLDETDPLSPFYTKFQAIRFGTEIKSSGFETNTDFDSLSRYINSHLSDFLKPGAKL